MEIIADKNEIKLFNKKNAGEGLGHKIQTIFTRKHVDIDVKQLVNQIKKNKKKQYNIFEKRVYKKNYSWTAEELHDQNKINIQNL